MASTEIPDIVIGRLPVYLRALSVMAAGLRKPCGFPARESAGMPPEFHQAASEIYERLREFKDTSPSIEEVLKKLHS